MTQQFYCVMIPKLITIAGSPWDLLPPGIHITTIDEIFKRFATNDSRKKQFDGLTQALNNLFHAGSPQIFLDGSYVTSKPIPADYEVCWDMKFVRSELLDVVFFDLSNYRKEQKEKYGGEFFPAQLKEGMSGKPFLDFFQTDKYTGMPKGILQLQNYITGGTL